MQDSVKLLGNRALQRIGKDLRLCISLQLRLDIASLRSRNDNITNADVHIEGNSHILYVASDLSAYAMIFALHRNRFSLRSFESHKVVSRRNSQNFCNDFIHMGKIIVQASHKKVYIHSCTAFKVGKGVNEEAAL